MKLRNILKLVENDYRMSHTAPNSEDGAPLYDLTGKSTGNEIYPDDVYSEKAIRLYGTSFADVETFNIIKSTKNKPDKIVDIYRAAPPEAKTINPGDWVTLTKKYALRHKESNGEPNWKILNKKVKASELYTNGDSWDEWGYQPN